MATDGVKYPYVMGTDKFVGFLQKIPDIGMPDKFTLKNLKSLGYTSSNDERFMSALRFIGFLDTNGVPSSLWKEARGHLGAALAKGIRSGYSDLFSQYSNAFQKDDEALRTFFSVHSGTGKEAVTKMVATFKSMCSIADFSSASQETDTETDQSTKTATVQEKSRKINSQGVSSGSPGGMPVSINIQLQLPPDPTGEIYDKFFAAMVKHLPVKQ